MNKNILLCGVGGQGTVLASRLIALAAMEKGMTAKGAETIGMAQRGGSVVSHVRVGEDIHSPLIPHKKADLIIGFEPAEAVRCLPYLKENGTVIVCPKDIQPVTSSLMGGSYNGKEMIDYLKKNVKNIVLVDGEEICRQCGSEKVLNVVLLGKLKHKKILKNFLLHGKVTLERHIHLVFRQCQMNKLFVFIHHQAQQVHLL